MGSFVDKKASLEIPKPHCLAMWTCSSSHVKTRRYFVPYFDTSIGPFLGLVTRISGCDINAILHIWRRLFEEGIKCLGCAIKCCTAAFCWANS